MNTTTSLILSCLALIFLVAAIGTRMLRARIREMKARRFHPQSVATSATSAAGFQSLPAIQASDNFKNLFEVPTLFYPLCVGLIATGHASTAFAAAAWAFVMLRIIHSVIQCTHNQVKPRFLAFVASSAVLLGMWTAFALALLFALGR